VDPNANLAEQLELARELVDDENPDAARLAELVIALDEWIARGGFLPLRWARPPREPPR